MYTHNNIKIARIDSRNYTVDNGGLIRYYPRLDQAVREAARQSADNFGELWDWLEEYKKASTVITANLRTVDIKMTRDTPNT